MGVVRSTQSMEAEVADLREILLRSSGGKEAWKMRSADVRRQKDGYQGAADGRMVCATGATSYVGLAVVNRLLDRGYSVRLVLETQEDLDKLREMDLFGELGGDDVWALIANPMDLDSLCRAFDGCSGVFHNSSFDPHGISGYSKHMADLEVKVAEQVIEACVRTQSVGKCVFTSSLLSCVWRRDSPRDRRRPTVVDENCWSDETFCRDKKLWFALGKTMAEKAAWRTARGRDLKLVTICPALVTGPGFRSGNSTGSIAYLKGASDMFEEGLLATADVASVADAHVAVYEAMSFFACGRYICYDHVFRRSEEAAELERQLGLPSRISRNRENANDRPFWFQLSNWKLTRLMTASRRRCTNDTYSIFYS